MKLREAEEGTTASPNEEDKSMLRTRIIGNMPSVFWTNYCKRKAK
jgi:hypothetical protein